MCVSVQAERAARDAEKLKETMALLDAFEQTREPVKAGYGSTNDPSQKFRQERSQAAGRAMWEVHLSTRLCTHARMGMCMQVYVCACAIHGHQQCAYVKPMCMHAHAHARVQTHSTLHVPLLGRGRWVVRAMVVAKLLRLRLLLL